MKEGTVFASIVKGFVVLERVKCGLGLCQLTTYRIEEGMSKLDRWYCRQMLW